jgi:hypothetical protein
MPHLHIQTSTQGEGFTDIPSAVSPGSTCLDEKDVGRRVCLDHSNPEIRWMMKIYEDYCLWCSHSIGQSFTPPYSMWLISLLARHVCFIVKKTMFLGEWRGCGYGLNINVDALPIAAGCLVQDISEGATEDISRLAPGISCCCAGLKDWFTIW